MESRRGDENRIRAFFSALVTVKTVGPADYLKFTGLAVEKHRISFWGFDTVFPLTPVGLLASQTQLRISLLENNCAIWRVAYERDQLDLHYRNRSITKKNGSKT